MPRHRAVGQRLGGGPAGQVGHQSRVKHIDLRRRHDQRGRLPRLVGIQDFHNARRLQNGKIAFCGRLADARVPCDVGVVQHLGGAGGHGLQESVEHIEIRHLRKRAHVPLQIGLDVGTVEVEPVSAGIGREKEARVAPRPEPREELGWRARILSDDEVLRQIRDGLGIARQFPHGHPMEIEDADPARQGLGDLLHHLELPRPRQPVHADGLVRILQPRLVDTLLYVREKLWDILNLVNRHWRGIVREKETRIRLRHLLHVGNVEGDEAALRLRDAMEEGGLANLPGSCDEQSGKESVRPEKRCFEVSPDDHLHLLLCGNSKRDFKITHLLASFKHRCPEIQGRVCEHLRRGLSWKPAFLISEIGYAISCRLCR